ncbi:Outer membrane porin F precursor [Roseovarius sp. THAF27]|uniref:OmpA family protein n=1 Tax=Roseovarius sp. THAF27 TaxID=2587850 RepID=UPI0012A9D022|nr:OmpA family protein [Roseovarius sp. THAF27]QFT79787.1 Outer membrane porin F precursor [Roseovarius sp. THAF27]
MGQWATSVGLILGLGAAAEAGALELSLPAGATLTGEVRRAAEAYLVPTDVYADGQIPAIDAEGFFLQQAWRLDAPGLTSLQLQRPLRRQVVEAGYSIMLDCAARECGGFDFRFNTRILPAPDMFVDLRDYRFLSARKEGAGGVMDYVTVLVSQVSGSGYIQVIRLAQSETATGSLTAEEATPPEETVTTGGMPEAETGPLAERLTQVGHAVLSDLDFETGTVSLGPGPHPSLQALAAFLREDPERRVALVGHTDTVGTLENNTALSRRRAAAVLERLVSEYDIPRRQLAAEGMGYLAPVASNLTEEGREANRRVEAVLLNTE